MPRRKGSAAVRKRTPRSAESVASLLEAALDLDTLLSPFVTDIPAERLAGLSAALVGPLADLRCELERAERAREERPAEAAAFLVLALWAARHAVIAAARSVAPSP